MSLIQQNMGAIYDGSQRLIAPVLNSTTATKNWAVGEEFILDGNLYKVTTAISSGSQIIVSGSSANCALADTVTEQIKNLEINSIYRAIATGKHTTATANTYELAGSFTISNPMVVIIRAHYTNTKPTGIIVSGSSVGNGIGKLEVDSESIATLLSLTVLLDTGTYNIYTKYQLTGENNYSVNGLNFNLI